MVNYKFILEEIAGTVSWQPGPDRVLETWDTVKTISVSEYWDSPDFQNIVEEEPVVVDDVNESSLDDSGFLIAENWDQTDDVSEEEVCANISSLDKKLVEEGIDVMKEEIDGDERMSDHSDEPSMLMVAENITEEQDLSERDEGLGLMSVAGEEQVEMTLGDHGRSDSSMLKYEKRLMIDEGFPVLVPGLATLPPEEVEAEEAEAEAQVSINVRSTTDVSDEILEVTTTLFDEIEDSTDLNNNNVVEDTATESDEIEDSTDPNPINTSIVEDTTAESDETEAEVITRQYSHTLQTPYAEMST